MTNQIQILLAKVNEKGLGVFEGMKRGCNFGQDLTYSFYRNQYKISVKLGLKNPYLCMCTKFPFQPKAV